MLLVLHNKVRGGGRGGTGVLLVAATYVTAHKPGREGER